MIFELIWPIYIAAALWLILWIVLAALLALFKGVKEAING
jgi:hypothetical protein